MTTVTEGKDGARDDRSTSAGFNESRYGSIRFGGDDLKWDDRVRTVLDLVRKTGAKRILDVGCGDGFLSADFRKLGMYTIGVDASPGAVEAAKGRCDEAYVADLGNAKLPVPDACVDLIWAGEIIEHIFDTETFVEDLLRVLQPGGRLIMSTPNLASWINRVSLAIGQQPFFTELGVRKSNWGSFLRKVGEPAGHIRNFTPGGLRHLLVSCGWTYESLHGAGLITSKSLRGFDKAVSHAFPSLATDLIIICRK
ncbi:MAG: SAM-dependent methyltransferase [Fibrobacteres bacterium]|nr:SAM-dependent methyltransferase [Fibrobacterota bacterium]